MRGDTKCNEKDRGRDQSRFPFQIGPASKPPNLITIWHFTESFAWPQHPYSTIADGKSLKDLAFANFVTLISLKSQVI